MSDCDITIKPGLHPDSYRCYPDTTINWCSHLDQTCYVYGFNPAVMTPGSFQITARGTNTSVAHGSGHVTYTVSLTPPPPSGVVAANGGGGIIIVDPPPMDDDDDNPNDADDRPGRKKTKAKSSAAKAKSKSKSKPKTKSKAKAKPKAKSKPKASGKAKPKAKSKPKAKAKSSRGKKR